MGSWQPCSLIAARADNYPLQFLTTEAQFQTLRTATETSVAHPAGHSGAAQEPETGLCHGALRGDEASVASVCRNPVEIALIDESQLLAIR